MTFGEKTENQIRASPRTHSGNGERDEPIWRHLNELEIKRVLFMGTELMAARDTDGQIWAGVRWMCDGIGLTKSQGKSQVEKINDDKVLCKGVGNFRLPTSGGMQDAYCLKLDFVPLWLAKISITPTMEQETPELAEKLMEYQLKASVLMRRWSTSSAGGPAPICQ